MMAIHGLVPGILPILLTIMLIIPPILFTTFILAIPFKTLVGLDISRHRIPRIRITPSRKYPGGKIFTTYKHCSNTHIIGDVMDGDIPIQPGSPILMSKYILVIPLVDGGKFVRITERFRNSGGYYSRIAEFLRKAGEDAYNRVQKEFIEMEVTTQESDRNIIVELKVPQDDPGEGTSSSEYPIRIASSEYTVIPERLPYACIGMVKYEGQILSGQTEGLLERKVIWEGESGSPKITILSLYANGVEGVMRCNHVNGTWYCSNVWRQLVRMNE